MTGLSGMGSDREADQRQLGEQDEADDGDRPARGRHLGNDLDADELRHHVARAPAR